MKPARALAGAAVLGAWVALALGVGPVRGQAPATDSCLECHSQLDEERLVKPTRNFAADVHAQHRLGCAGCHGGDPKDMDVTAMDPGKGFRGVPGYEQIAEFCARCHADAELMKRYNPQPYIFSMAEFRTSVHCKKIAEGDKKVATCTNCHGVHPILSRKDPKSPVYKANVPSTCARCHNADYMKGRKVRTDQYALYRRSVHGKALLEKGDVSAPACNSCHGNHGAVPPNTQNISLVCGNCHGREGELFAASRVRDALELAGKRGCVTCHGNHDVQVPTDEMVSTRPPGLCGQCHWPNSPGDKATALIVPGFHGLKSGIAEAESLLRLAEEKGMETASGRELLKQASDQLVSVRAVLHSFDRVQIMTVLNEGAGLASQAARQGRAALLDWRNRRIGMALSLVVILALMGLLIARIRRMERGAAPAPEGGAPQARG